MNNTPEIEIKPQIIAESFAYPIGETENVTQAKDKKDKWYNAQDFTVNNHLGEDWNGNADGKYLCHLHFELREESCPMWTKAGAGYDSENKGWLDPSDFIDKNKK